MLTPFDVLYNALVTQLVASGDFTAKNVIIFDKDSNPKKAAVQSADLPEVLLALSDLTGNYTENSSSVKLTPQYKYMLSTGSYDSTVIHKLLFNVLRLNADFENTLSPLTWKSRRFVQNSRIVSAPIGESNPDANRNIRGWAGIVTIEFELYLNKQDFKEGLV